MKQTAHSQTHTVSVHSVSHPCSTADSYVNMWVHSVHGRPISWHPEAELCLTWESALSFLSFCFFFYFHLTASITGCSNDVVKLMCIMFLEKLQRVLVLLLTWHDASNPQLCVLWFYFRCKATLWWLFNYLSFSVLGHISHLSWLTLSPRQGDSSVGLLPESISGGPHLLPSAHL